jgi:hypothetical protein
MPGSDGDLGLVFQSASQNPDLLSYGADGSLYHPVARGTPDKAVPTIHRPPPLAARILPTSAMMEAMAGSLSLLTMKSQASHPISLKKAMHLRAMNVPVLLEGHRPTTPSSNATRAHQESVMFLRHPIPLPSRHQGNKTQSATLARPYLNAPANHAASPRLVPGSSAGTNF